MKNAMNKLLLCIAFMLIAASAGHAQSNVHSIQETYTYSIKSACYTQPAVLNGEVERSALTTDTEDGTFFCFTENESLANDFINAQRTLVHYLQSCGVEMAEITFYGTDYGYSFSESSKNEVYAALSDMHSWQQVIVTLQTIWGDYTDYGYVYAMANAIANELGWQTDSIPAFDAERAALFFTENLSAINLLYPAFSEKFASEDAINNSKVLAIHLFEKSAWKDALKEPVAKQLDNYYAIVSGYAGELSIPFERQACGYAPYGEAVKLRIMTTYAELIIDSNYHDTTENVYGDYWADYASIYQTANTINNEITASVEYFGLEDEAGIIQIKWLDSESTATQQKLVFTRGLYSSSTAYITSIRSYLHEYYHHIEHLINPFSGATWQSQAFCELGASHSQYARMSTEYVFSESEDGIKLFHAFTGRAYETGRDDHFEAMDILCYYNNYYALSYITGVQAHNSFCRYLTDLYEERAVYDLLLFPETVETATGKTWEELRAAWEQHIRDKYADVQIPN